MNEIKANADKRDAAAVADELGVTLGRVDQDLAHALELLEQLPIPLSQVRQLQVGIRQIRGSISTPIKNILGCVKNIATAVIKAGKGK